MRGRGGAVRSAGFILAWLLLVGLPHDQILAYASEADLAELGVDNGAHGCGYQVAVLGYQRHGGLPARTPAESAKSVNHGQFPPLRARLRGPISRPGHGQKIKKA